MKNTINIKRLVALFLIALLPTLSIGKISNKILLLQYLINKNLPFERNMTSDSIVSWGQQADYILDKSNRTELLYQVRNLVTRSYAMLGDFTLATDRLKMMEQETQKRKTDLSIFYYLNTKADVLREANMKQQAIDVYKEALKYIPSDAENKWRLKARIYPDLTLLLFQLGRNSEGLKCLEELDKVALTSGAYVQFLTKICYTFYYLNTNQYVNAYKTIQEEELISQREYHLSMSMMLHHMKATYYDRIHDYRKVLKEYNLLLSNHILSHGQYVQYFKMVLECAKIYAKLGDKKSACIIYEKANMMQDSLSRISYARQIEELQTVYRLNQMEINSQEAHARLVTIALIALGISIMILIAFIVFVRRRNKLMIRTKIKLEQAKKYAENSVLAKSLFISNMSHEIRTPLNALSGFSTILTDPSIDMETRKQCDDIIQQNSDLLLNLINDVIDLSRMDLGKMSFCFKECDAINICRNVVDTVSKVKQTQAEVLFTTEYQKLTLLTDESRLQQVLINLLINATKFTPEGTITLDVSPLDDNTVCFSVTDTGCGIPLDKQPDIFNRFEKLHENIQGSGLGLAICKLIVEHIGGRIWIDSSYTAGSRFVFTHPLSPAAAKMMES